MEGAKVLERRDIYRQSPMAYSKDILFGPVTNEQPDYWERNDLARRDRSLLDRHFDSRSRGGQWKNGQDPSVSAYSIPRSQKVALRESPVGGIPAYEGGGTSWDDKYLQAQAKLAGRAPTNLPDPFQGRSPMSPEEVDVSRLLQTRAATQGPQLAGPQSQGPRTCTLQEGHTFYQALQIQGFGTTQPLAKTGGLIKGVQGREFQIEGAVTAYVVDGLQTIDLSKMEPGRLRPLIRVTAPLLGTFLVPQEAIQEQGGQGPSRGLLIDSGQHHRVDQRSDQRAQWQAQQQQAQHGLLIPNASQHLGRQSIPSQQFAPQSRPANPQEILQQQQREMMRRRGILKG